MSVDDREIENTDKPAIRGTLKTDTNTKNAETWKREAEMATSKAILYFRNSAEWYFKANDYDNHDLMNAIANAIDAIGD